ncbi:hypothetical protein GCM10020367_14760 [Streptomyces sannanensis]|uniref:Uncharacterized protein n=1 Tax=Streptomyces sannanensis TaxID=285536 RepID=A0ABP6S7I8_9ACTN
MVLSDVLTDATVAHAAVRRRDRDGLADRSCGRCRAAVVRCRRLLGDVRHLLRNLAFTVPGTTASGDVQMAGSRWFVRRSGRG